jgi:hypothetical protein
MVEIFHVNTLRLRSPDWKGWLSASLFPLKIYTLVAVPWLIVWHSRLPQNRSSGLNGFLDERWFYVVSDFSAVAGYVRFGYFVVALVLLIGGVVQSFKQSPKSASGSIAFGIAAVVLGTWLGGYCHYELMVL